MSGGELAARIGDATRSSANWLQLLKFSVVGGSGYAINLVVFALLVNGAGVHHTPAAIGAFCVAVTNNYLLNRTWTFGPGEGRAAFQAARFLVVSVASLMINLVVLEALVAGAQIGELPAQALAVAIAMPFNFLGNKLWTFA